MNEPPQTLMRDVQTYNPVRRQLETHDILVRGDTIVHCKGAAQVQGPVTAWGGTGKIAIPGLSNVHTHGHAHLGKGEGDTWTLELLLNAMPGLNAGLTDTDKELSCLVGGLDMIRQGVTSCYDMFLEFAGPTLDGLHAAQRGYQRAGVRARLAPMVSDVPFHRAVPGLLASLPNDLAEGLSARELPAREVTLARIEDWLEHWDQERDGDIALGPTIPLHCTDAFLVECRELCRRYAIPMQMHLAESRIQASAGLATYGKSLTAHLDDIGVLSPAFTAAHAIWLDDDDLDRLAARGASVAHNPGSNLRLGSGIARAKAMLRRGIRVGIGTDGAQSSDHTNMFEAMRMAALVSRVLVPDDAQWITAHEALAMGAAGGAAITSTAGGRTGSIAVGQVADIVLLDANSLTYLPLNDFANQLIYAESGSSVWGVMVGGVVRYQEGRFPGIDLAEVIDRVRERRLRLAVVSEPARRLARALEPWVRQHCLGLHRPIASTLAR